MKNISASVSYIYRIELFKNTEVLLKTRNLFVKVLLRERLGPSIYYKMSETLKVHIHFGGGAELLFDKIKKHDIELPAMDKYFPDCGREKWTIKDLLVWIKDNLLKERPELFLQRDSVRPGILVLINDADWELFGELNYELQPNDVVMFISTLHGG